MKKLIIIFISLTFLQCFLVASNVGYVIFDYSKTDTDPVVYYLFNIDFPKVLPLCSSCTTKPENKQIDEDEYRTITRVDHEKYQGDFYRRMYLRKGDILYVCAIVESSAKNVNFSISEKNRKSRFLTDFFTLLELYSTKITTEEVKKKYSLFWKCYTIKNFRSEISLTVQPVLNDPGKVVKKEVTIITGRKEHFFLSADVLVSKISDVKWVNGDNKVTLSPKETPKEFYIGINYDFNDVQIKDKSNWINYIYLKGMFKFGKSPFESFGLGIGLRLPKLLGIGFGDFSIFGAYVWTKEEFELDGETFNKRKGQILLGLSYEIGTAKKWGDTKSK